MRAQSLTWMARGAPFHPASAADDGTFPAILEHLIRQRGLPTGQDLEGFLRPRLKDRGEKVCIFGDYDVDGVSSITLMKRILRAYGLEADFFIPRRGAEGYGLSLAALQRCLNESGKPNP